MKSFKKIQKEALIIVTSGLFVLVFGFTNCAKLESRPHPVNSLSALSAPELQSLAEPCELQEFLIDDESRKHEQCVTFYIDAENGSSKVDGLDPENPINSYSLAIQIANRLLASEEARLYQVLFVFVDNYDHAVDSTKIEFDAKEVTFHTINFDNFVNVNGQ